MKTLNTMGKKHSIMGAVFLMMMGIVTNSYAEYNSQSWATWVQQLRHQAVAQGINPSLFDHLFNGMVPSQKVLGFEKHQPERRLTFMQYRQTRIDPFRIRLGKSAYHQREALFNSIGHRYNVDPCFLTAFWGIETSYGHYLGTFPVVNSLATLAYASPRKDYFRNELLIALRILNEAHITQDKFVGEWAGASGQPQFMPSSWERYAVDYDGDGHKNIWTNYSDAFASIANYLRLNGWQGGQPWGVIVTLPANFNTNLASLNTEKSVADWLHMGVIINSSGKRPDNSLRASIVRLNGGPDFMVFNNYKVVMKYNNSTFYAA